ncbi:glycosyltransferase family A protein [Acidicapsa acidisoli]|uniref:glycosyltransferase family A protein n=1 Tax=Acidicapsa acidisoli TaxID=1615681 RepID=UPI0021E043A2|nr:glycosyltransferase family A protein [Acidicapsa acidisoli]
MTKLKVYINCGPCAEFVGKCITSVREQSYPDWEAWVTVDACGDDTYTHAARAARGDARFHLRRNQTRKYSMHNLVHAIQRSRPEPEDVIVCLDGDDWFSDRNALCIVAETYEKFNCWVTYGSWRSNVPRLTGGYDGLWPAYPEGTTDFRHHRFLGTAVRTWKKWLWDCLKDEDLRSDSGEYVRVSEDQMIMIPLLEMCGTQKARHIAAPIMTYNKVPQYAQDESLNREGLRNGELIERRTPYMRLLAKPAPADAAAD